MAEEQENTQLTAAVAEADTGMKVASAAAQGGAGGEAAEADGSGTKRSAGSGGDNEDGVELSKKRKVTDSSEGKDIVAEEREPSESKVEKGGEARSEAPVILGPKTFSSSLEMFDYFYKFLREWPQNLNINKYEHMVILDLLKKGHEDPGSKIGDGGIQAFQVRHHSMWKSTCYFLIHTDGTADDFSFRKCVNNILPLPDDMKAHLADIGNNHKGGGGGGGRGRGGSGGGGRGRGKWGRK